MRARSRRTGRWRRAAPVLATIGLVLAVVAGLLELIAGPGHRFGLWSFETGFALLRWAVYGGIAAAALSFAGLIAAPLLGHRRGMFRALAGIVIGLVVVGIPWSWYRTAQGVPPIHDVTTDTEDPPRFLAVRPLRADAPNPSAYGGDEVAAQQREAYPDIRPVTTSLAPAAAFDAALAAAQEMDWEIVAADEAEGRIEAVDETFWFGFKDDIVVRVRAADDGSRIDVRSVSRVGKSDLGKNAARIRAYLEALEAQSG